jgi:hypothetical protein
MAVDDSCGQITERKRSEKGLMIFEAAGRTPRCIAMAAAADCRLSTNDPRRIVLIETRVA